MLIKIDNSVTEYIINNYNTLTLFSNEIRALNSIACSYLNMQHLITADINTLEYLSECKLLSEAARKTFLFLTSKLYYLGALEEKYRYKTIVHKLDFNFKREKNY